MTSRATIIHVITIIEILNTDGAFDLSAQALYIFAVRAIGDDGDTVLPSTI